MIKPSDVAVKPETLELCPWCGGELRVCNVSGLAFVGCPRGKGDCPGLFMVGCDPDPRLISPPSKRFDFAAANAAARAVRESFAGDDANPEGGE